MLVHFDSITVHIIEVQTNSRPEYQILKANGIFLNFANEQISVHFDVLPKNNPDWRHQLSQQTTLSVLLLN